MLIGCLGGVEENGTDALDVRRGEDRRTRFEVGLASVVEEEEDGATGGNETKAALAIRRACRARASTMALANSGSSTERESVTEVDKSMTVVSEDFGSGTDSCFQDVKGEIEED